jgi:ABC-type uncharacterized transport system permease subunit
MSDAKPAGAPAAKPSADPSKADRAQRVRAAVLLPIEAVVLAVLIGSVFVYAAAFIKDGKIDIVQPITAYRALISGSLLGFDPIVATLVAATPLIFGGLAVALGFKAGLFNIGVQGQLLMGVLGAVAVGVALHDQPTWIAAPLAFVAGTLAGASFGFIAGALKAFRGAHEVVVTIMLNSLAAIVIVGLVNDVFKITGPTFARTADVGNAALPIIFGRDGSLGILIALAVVPIAYVLIYRTTLGFEIRTAGANPSAARYAGMSPRRLIILTMSLCGLFAGLAGAIEILDLGYYPAVFGTTIGFAGITVGLLGRAHPVGILLAALLLGGMRAGAPAMQITAKIPIEIIDVIQGLILVFLAAEVVIRQVFRIRAERATPGELKTVTASYGSGQA